MALISPAELADLRAEQRNAMPDSADILVKVEGTRDQHGDKPVGWETATTVPCRIDPIKMIGRGNEGVSASMFMTTTPSFALTIPWDTPLDDANRVRIVSSGTEYEVSDAGLAGSYATARRATLVRVGRG